MIIWNLIMFIGATFSGVSQTVSTLSLLNEMVDLEQLSSFPEPGYSTIQFSSYDRHSEFPHYPGWFKNSDGFGGESIPGFMEVLEVPGNDGIGKYLICDEKGPGAIVRLWTAWIEGEITLWLDGNKDPV